MIRIFSIFLFIAIQITLLQAQPKNNTKQVIAKVGTHNILLKDYIERYEDYLIMNGVKDNMVVRRSILENMINEHLLEYYDDNRELLNNQDYQKELSWAEKQTILAYLKDQQVYAKITATDTEIRDAFYKSNVKISARHLYCDTEEEANSVYQLLQSGTSFNELAKQMFTDSTLQNNGGYLGYFSWGEMDPAFEDAAYSLQINEISKPVRTKFGYSIIKVEDRLPNPIMTETEFLKNKTHMQRVVRMRKRRAAELNFMDSLFDQKKVVLDEYCLNELLKKITNPNLLESSLNPNTICASYNKSRYSFSNLLIRVNEIPKYHFEKIKNLESLKSAVKGLILQDILYKISLKSGYQNSAEVKNTIKKYRKNIFLKYKRVEIASKAALPDSVVYDFYYKNVDQFRNSNQIEIQEIIVDQKLLADSLALRINSGEDFGMLAKTFSLREMSRNNSGKIGFADVGKFGILQDTLWKSEIGQIIGPIKIQDKFGIFKLLGKKAGEPKPFEEVYNDALYLAKKEKSKSIVQEYLDRLTPKNSVWVDDVLLRNFTITVK